VTIGNQIGTGKESDVFLGQNAEGRNVAVKFHRLGRTSFRSIKRNRDYHKGRSHASWLYLSRLAALKEFAYMKVLFENGFPVPTPIDVNRHVIVMEYLKGYTTLYHLNELKHPGRVYNTLMNLLVSLAECGLIHGDFNEFNLMVDENDNVIMIDFPQMVSIDHPNAEYYFNRDVEGVRNFFKKRFGFHGAEYPVLGKDTLRKHHLDRQIQASGFTKEMEEEFDSLAKENALAEQEEAVEEDGDYRGESSGSKSGGAAPAHNVSGVSGGNGARFEKVIIQQSADGEDDDDGDEDGEYDDNMGTDDGSGDEDVGEEAKRPAIAKVAEEDDDDDDGDDNGPPGETRRERRSSRRRRNAILPRQRPPLPPRLLRKPSSLKLEKKAWILKPFDATD